eukprot:Opistho-1_new@90624
MKVVALGASERDGRHFHGEVGAAVCARVAGVREAVGVCRRGRGQERRRERRRELVVPCRVDARTQHVGAEYEDALEAVENDEGVPEPIVNKAEVPEHPCAPEDRKERKVHQTVLHEVRPFRPRHASTAHLRRRPKTPNRKGEDDDIARDDDANRDEERSDEAVALRYPAAVRVPVLDAVLDSGVCDNARDYKYRGKAPPDRVLLPRHPRGAVAHLHDDDVAVDVVPDQPHPREGAQQAELEEDGDGLAPGGVRRLVNARDVYEVDEKKGEAQVHHVDGRDGAQAGEHAERHNRQETTGRRQRTTNVRQHGQRLRVRRGNGVTSAR